MCLCCRVRFVDVVGIIVDYIVSCFCSNAANVPTNDPAQRRKFCLLLLGWRFGRLPKFPKINFLFMSVYLTHFRYAFQISVHWDGGDWECCCRGAKSWSGMMQYSTFGYVSKIFHVTYKKICHSSIMKDFRTMIRIARLEIERRSKIVWFLVENWSLKTIVVQRLHCPKKELWLFVTSEYLKSRSLWQSIIRSMFSLNDLCANAWALMDNYVYEAKTKSIYVRVCSLGTASRHEPVDKPGKETEKPRNRRPE